MDGGVAFPKGDLLGSSLDVDAIEQFIGKKERCDVKALVERSLERNRAAAAKKQIVFLSGVPNGLWAKADRTALQQVLDHLIANAIKFSPPNATVQVHALPENDSVVISVRDQGLDINEAGRERLFRKFANLMAFPPNGKISSGIGMAIVKKLAEALSGSIRWRGDSDSGSAFILKLPAASESIDSPEFSDIKLLARRIVEFQARN